MAQASNLKRDVMVMNLEKELEEQIGRASCRERV